MPRCAVTKLHGKSMFNFVRHGQTVFQSGHTILQWMRDPLVSGVVSVLDFGCSNRCVVVSHGCLAFSDDIRCGTVCHGLTCHLYIFSDEVPVKVFGPFFHWVVCFLIAEFYERFCAFRITVPYQIWLLQIFSLSLWLVLFILLAVSFSEKNFILKVSC